MDVAAWEKYIGLERQQKDEFFAFHPQSPLSAEARARFKGLDYFPPDMQYRFVLQLHRHGEEESIGVEDTSGVTRQMMRWGEFHFEVCGQQCVLQAYRSDPQDERLFVPFRDATNGKETYPAGRYLDLDPARDLRPDGTWVVDLNSAYSPWCAYSNDYACPFVPPENRLGVRIPVGERTLSLDNA